MRRNIVIPLNMGESIKERVSPINQFKGHVIESISIRLSHVRARVIFHQTPSIPRTSWPLKMLSTGIPEAIALIANLLPYCSTTLKTALNTEVPSGVEGTIHRPWMVRLTPVAYYGQSARTFLSHQPETKSEPKEM
jgi:hypothetical protein